MWTLDTRLQMLPCMNQSLEAMWPEVEEFDFYTSIPSLEVPVFFFTGRHDDNTPFELTQEWAERLGAPTVAIVWFDESGHMPPLEQPEAFRRALIETVLPEIR